MMHQIKLLVVLETMVNISNMEYVRRRLGFDIVINNSSDKIWLFALLKFVVKL